MPALFAACALVCLAAVCAAKAEDSPLEAVVGKEAAALLFRTVPVHEGLSLTPYYCPAGVLTVCYGDTDPSMAVLGKSYTKEECRQALDRQLAIHGAPVVEYLGIDHDKYPHQTAAFVSLAYNIGVNGFRRSSTARLWLAGEHQEACQAMEAWRYAKGRELPGLVRRRADERRLCETGEFPENAVPADINEVYRNSPGRLIVTSSPSEYREIYELDKDPGMTLRNQPPPPRVRKIHKKPRPSSEEHRNIYGLDKDPGMTLRNQ
jgi:lysozyme